MRPKILNRRARDMFSLLALLLTLWSVLATSQASRDLQSGWFSVKSDCVSPTLEANITVSNYQITSPVGWTFQNLGFPQAILNPDSDISGVVNGISRYCAKTFGPSQSSKEFVISCWDNGEFVCNVHFK